MRPNRTAFWVFPDQKERLIGNLANTKRGFDRYDGGCLFVAHANGKPCGQPVKNVCHTIPRGPVLLPLSDRKSGKVLEIIWGFGEFVDLFIRGSEENPVDLFDPEKFQPRLIGTGEASCGRFACKNLQIADHDSEFSPIDVANPDFADPLVAFLAQYRADLWALYQLKRVAWLMKTWGCKNMRSGGRELLTQLMRTNEQLRNLLPFMQEKVTRLGTSWYVNGSSSNTANALIASQQLNFRSKLTCVLYGWSSVASIFPASGDLHQMAITNFVEDTQQDAEFTNGLIKVAAASMQKNDYGVDILAHLSNSSSGVIVMSPDSYDKLSGAERNVINQWIQRFAQADMMAKSINALLGNRQRRRWQGNRRR